MIFLEIESAEGLTAFLAEAKKTGLLKDVSMKDIQDAVRKKEFPLRIPVNLDAVLNLCRNPILRKLFGGKIESRAKMILAKGKG
jgi:hypothetical protein